MAEGGRTNSKLSGFLKGSAILVVSNVFLKAINFLLLPLYTSKLTPAMLGISDTITTLTGIVFPILVMGLDSAFSAFYFEKDEENRSAKVFHTLTWTFCVLGMIPLLLMLASGGISELLFHTRDYSYIVRFALASVSFNLWFLPYSLELRLKNRMFLYGLANVIASVSMMLLNILFVAVLQMGEVALVLSTFLVHVEQLLIFMLIVKQTPKREFYDQTLLKNMLRFAIPLVPMTILTWVLTLSDRYILLHYHGTGAVGLYGIGLRFTNLLNVVISAVAMAYTTFAFSSKDDEGAKRYYYYVFNVESFLLLGISFTIALFGKEIVLLLDSAYVTAYQPLQDLMFAQALYAMTTIVSYGIYFKKKSVYSLISVAAAAGLNLGLNFLLIPKYGIRAAALTTLLGFLLNFLLTLYFSERVYPCEYGQGKMALTAASLYAIAFLLKETSAWIKLIAWIAAAIGAVFLYRGVLIRVITYIKSALRARRKERAID